MKPAWKALLYLTVLSLLSIANGQVAEGLYRIQNVDNGLHITTEGANTAFARVVGENWQNFGEQRWRLEKSGQGLGTYILMPEKHTTNNALSYYRDAARKYAVPEKWSLIKVQMGYEIKNQRTGLCLISNGRRKEIVEGTCDKYLPDRHWQFKKI